MYVLQSKFIMITIKQLKNTYYVTQKKYKLCISYFIILGYVYENHINLYNRVLEKQQAIRYSVIQLQKHSS